MDLDAAEHAALSDLVGAGNIREDISTQQAAPDDAVTGRRTSSTRIAATEAAKETKRRKAAHILVRNFKFLSHPDAVAALKARMDDYVSTVSWAADERLKNSKAGMQAKSEASLRKIVEEMRAADVTKHTATRTDKPTTSSNA
ncbi:hypothetical protein EXIGLDRAFT_783692 [Exidia glandulosa HHB12029]|uniref:Uncharacterized protein n=1 Tax=Exidia glandulosa HHB12029 TaxID=1314781 RepID=A0A166MX92_EXIGL|nr:hypothetical protein EXIGLDRAFT_783692 [Exidia glandulosa HHB12029]